MIKTFPIHWDAEELAGIKKAAKECGVTATKFMTEAVRKAVKEVEKK